MSTTEIALLTATELRRGIENRDFSPVEVVEACLRRVELLNPQLNAVVTLNENALDETRRLQDQVERGRAEAGLLYGLPAGIKDVTPVAGLRCTYGCSLYADNVAQEDALIVRRLRRQGAIVLGKTNTPEFAAGGNTFNEVFGRTRNPWNRALSPGGSTGGGAAGLAAGMFALAEGTDLGGSLRIPASFCGLFGLRPSPGLVPVHPTSYPWDTLQVSGGMARCAQDLALMLQAVSGPSAHAPMAQSMKGRDFPAAVRSGPKKNLRLAYAPDIAAIGVDPEIEEVCRRAAFELEQRNCIVEEIDLDLSFARQAFLTLRGYEIVAVCGMLIAQKDSLGPNLKGNLESGMATETRTFAQAEHQRAQIWEVFKDLLLTYDHLLTPCMAIPPFPVERNFPETIAGRPMQSYVDWIAPTFVLSLTGLPVASAPCGLDSRGLPVGLQIVGRPQDEESVLSLASLFAPLKMPG